MMPGRRGSGRLATGAQLRIMVGQGGEARLTTGLWGEVSWGADYREIGGNSEEGQTCLQGKLPQLVLHNDSGGTEAQGSPWPVLWTWDAGACSQWSEDLARAWVSFPSTVSTEKEKAQLKAENYVLFGRQN